MFGRNWKLQCAFQIMLGWGCSPRNENLNLLLRIKFVMSLNRSGEVYSLQHYVIKFVSNLWNNVESSIKHDNPKEWDWWTQTKGVRNTLAASSEWKMSIPTGHRYPLRLQSQVSSTFHVFWVTNHKFTFLGQIWLEAYNYC